MYDSTLEIGASVELGLVAVVVAVVAGAGENESARDLQRFAGVGPFGGDEPAGCGRVPLDADHAVVEPDPLVDALVAGCVLYVAADLVAVDDHVVTVPWTEGEPERVHVGVRTNPRIPEEVPGPAHRRARFEDGVRCPRSRFLEVVAGTDAGETSSDDQDVEMLDVAHRPAAAREPRRPR